MKARLSDDRSTVALTGAIWSTTFPVTQLDAWLDFYRRLMRRRNPRTGADYARSYGDTVSELERVRAELRAAGRPAA